MKDELGGKIMTEFVAVRPKSYSYLLDDGNSDKKAKGTKECLIKRIPYRKKKSRQKRRIFLPVTNFF